MMHLLRERPKKLNIENKSNHKNLMSSLGKLSKSHSDQFIVTYMHLEGEKEKCLLKTIATA